MNSNSISCTAVLLDIEGTVSPVAFVYDVMFPFIRNNVESFLRENRHLAPVQEAIRLVGEDIGRSDTQTWLNENGSEPLSTVTTAVHQLMDRDAKVTGLKQLQGLIWKDGFDSGQLVAELFSDVLPKLKQWKSTGLDLYIYSSGSIGAQKLFFGHTTEGDLLSLFSGHFDTTSGNKKEAGSYTCIADQIGVAPSSICFVSDVVAELDAAAEAGMKTLLRPTGDIPDGPHPCISSFEEIHFTNAGSTPRDS